MEDRQERKNQGQRDSQGSDSEGSGFEGIQERSSMDPEKIEMEVTSTPPDSDTIPHPEETSTKEENGSPPPVIVREDEEIDLEEHLICEPGIANITILCLLSHSWVFMKGAKKPTFLNDLWMRKKLIKTEEFLSKNSSIRTSIFKVLMQ